MSLSLKVLTGSSLMCIFIYSHIWAILHETLADKVGLDQQLCFQSLSTLQEEKPTHRTNVYFITSSKLQLTHRTKDPSVKQHCCGGHVPLRWALQSLYCKSYRPQLGPEENQHCSGRPYFIYLEGRKLKATLLEILWEALPFPQVCESRVETSQNQSNPYSEKMRDIIKMAN